MRWRRLLPFPLGPVDHEQVFHVVVLILNVNAPKASVSNLVWRSVGGHNSAGKVARHPSTLAEVELKSSYISGGGRLAGMVSRM